MRMESEKAPFRRIEQSRLTLTVDSNPDPGNAVAVASESNAVRRRDSG
jgi:hypothetical protein